MIEPLDLGAPNSASVLQASIERRGIEVDVLVNNAGFGFYEPFLNHDAARLRSMLQLDIISLVELTQGFGRQMAARKHGRVLLVGSMAAYQPVAHQAAYSAAKAFVLSLPFIPLTDPAADLIVGPTHEGAGSISPCHRLRRDRLCPTVPNWARHARIRARGPESGESTSTESRSGHGRRSDRTGRRPSCGYAGDDAPHTKLLCWDAADWSGSERLQPPIQPARDGHCRDKWHSHACGAGRACGGNRRQPPDDEGLRTIHDRGGREVRNGVRPHRDGVHSQKGDRNSLVSDSGTPDGETYRLIETTAYAGVQRVRLYEETWKHIADEHPEFESRLPSLEHAIVDTIINPTLVCASTTQPDTSVVFTSSNNVKGSGRILCVPIRIIGDTASGRVTTAMFASAPKGKVLFEEGGEDE